MEKLPDEILIEIFSFLLPLKYCNIHNILNCQKVCKKWKRIVNDIEIRNRYLNNILGGNINILYYKDYYNDLHLLYELDCHHNIFKQFNIFFLEILTFDYIKKLPICYFKNSKCLDNMCSHECYINNHNLKDYVSNINSGIFRGIDDKGRHYILLFYKNLSTNEILYEFLYHKKLINNYNMVSYSGVYNKSYIGMCTNISNNLYYYYQNYREIGYESYNYLIRLLNKMPCGIMKYNPDTDEYYESYSELVRIL